MVDPLSPEDIANKIMMFLHDKELRMRKIKLGRNRVQKFTWEKTAQKTLQLYEQIIKKRN
jgi:glycosyltransferase involved in cell wall biosynthesis